LHGVANAGIATVFPEPIGLAATFDAPLVRNRWMAEGDYVITVGGGQPGTPAPRVETHLMIRGRQPLPESNRNSTAMCAPRIKNLAQRGINPAVGAISALHYLAGLCVGWDP
jgi:hypothetical protein